MNQHLSIRVMSFALAAGVTLSVMVGIDTLAQEQHAGSAQVAKANGAGKVAAAQAVAAKSARGI